MTITEILEYISTTPENSNVNVLKDMLIELAENTSSTALPSDIKFMPIQISESGEKGSRDIVFVDVFAGTDLENLQFFSRLNLVDAISENYYLYYICPLHQGNSNLMKGKFLYFYEGEGNAVATLTPGDGTEIIEFTNNLNGYMFTIKPYYSSNTITQLTFNWNKNSN